MEHSPAQIIFQLLSDLGLVGESGTWPAYISFFPDTPNEAVCLYDMPGEPDGRVMTTGERIDHQGVQVRVRGRVYDSTWTKAHDIALALDAQDKVVVVMDSATSYTIANISRRGTIMPMGVDPDDDHHRHNFSLNMVVTLREDT